MPVLTPGAGGMKLKPGKRLLSRSRLAHLSYGSDANAAAAFAARLVLGG